ncbi:MAG TPA: alpha/beta hydrolase [Streptosporangiaceae bacterium]
MRQIDMTVRADDRQAIAGTLTTPVSQGPHPAVALLCPARSDQEGDEAGAPLGLGQALAAALADAGVASYRFDHRGTGETPGDSAADGFRQDRKDAAAVLRGLAARPEVSAVGVIGYSDAGLHAAWLAAHGDAAAAVLLASPVRAAAGDDQPARRPDPAGPQLTARLARRLPGSARQQAARAMGRLRAGVTAGHSAARGADPEYLGYDPRPDLTEIRVPVLAITGANDPQAGEADLEAIASLVPGPVDTRRVPDITHLLRRDARPPSPRANRQQYRRPVDSRLLAEIAAWVAAHLPRQPARQH